MRLIHTNVNFSGVVMDNASMYESMYSKDASPDLTKRDSFVTHNQEVDRATVLKTTLQPENLKETQN